MTHDEFWRRLCAEIDRAEWADDPRFATMQARFEHRDELLDALGARLTEASAAEWVERLRPLGIAVGEVVDLADALDGDLVRDRGMVVSVDTPEGPLRMVGNPIRFAGRAARSTASRRACTSTPTRCSTHRRIRRPSAAPDNVCDVELTRFRGHGFQAAECCS